MMHQAQSSGVIQIRKSAREQSPKCKAGEIKIVYALALTTALAPIEKSLEKCVTI